MIEPLTKKQQALAEGGVGAVRAMTIKYKLRSPWLEDEIDSAAMLALVTAASTFDPRAGRAWIGWLIWHVASQMRELFRKSNTHSERFVSLGQNYSSKPNPEAETPSDCLARLEQTSRWTELMTTLPTKQQEICRLVYHNGLNVAEASRMMGISRQGGHCLQNSRSKSSGRWPKSPREHIT